MAYLNSSSEQVGGTMASAPVVHQATSAPGGPQPPPQQPHQQQNYPPQPPGFMNTPDTTGEYTQEDINQNKMMGVLAYLGILVLIPLFAAKESKFARYHTNQGLILLILYGILLVFNILLGAVWRIRFFYASVAHPAVTWITFLLSIPLLVLSIIGIVNVVNGKVKELPVVGKFKLIK